MTRAFSALILVLSACQSDGSVPEFSLEDVNPASPTAGQMLGPQHFDGQVSAWYFGMATCPICQGHFDELDAMSARLKSDEPGAAITILGINQAGRESANDVITDRHTLAWLQDTDQADVFGVWPPVQIRELKVVGPDGTVAAVFDLNTQDPAEEAVQTEIEDLLLSLAPVLD